MDDFSSDTSTTGILEIDSTATGTIEVANDRDWFAIELTAGQTVRIASGGFNANLTLRDEFGLIVAFDFRDLDTNENALVFQVQESGTFYVDVSSFGSPLDYTLTATVLDDDFANTTGTTGALDIGGTSTGTIDFTNDSDWFAIELTAGEAVRIASNVIDANMVLRDEFGNFVAFDFTDFATNENVIIAQVGASGTFYVDVTSFGSPLDYTLTATAREDDFVDNTGTTGVLEVGGTATGTTNFTNDSDWFAIELTAGDTIRIASDANLTLRDGFANFIAFDFTDFATNENVIIAQVEESGTYFIDVRSFGSPFDYTLTATEIEDDFVGNTNTTGVLASGGTATGIIEFTNDSDWFAIELTAGEVIRIASNVTNANLVLQDALGNFVTSNFTDFETNENVINAQVGESGTYYVDVTSFGSPLNYTLTATAIDDDFLGDTGTAGVLEVGVDSTGSIDFRNDSDWFAIELTAGEAVRIASTNTSIDLVLRDDLGNFVAFDFRDFGTNENVIIAQTGESGTFYIDVSSFNSPLDYTLTVTAQEDDFSGDTGTTGVLAPGDTATGTINFRGDEDWFAITISDTDIGLRLSVDDSRVELSVIDPNGDLVTSSTESRTINFSEVGTYFVAAIHSSTVLVDYTISSIIVDTVDVTLAVEDTGIVDTVAEEDNDITYSLTSDGTLIRYSNQDETLLPNLELGVPTSALSLSQDGNYLFVAQANLVDVGNGVFEATVLRIDAETLVTESFSFEVTGNGYLITDIQAAADGSLFVTTNFPGSGWVPFYNLSGFDTVFSADIIDEPEFSGFNGVRQNTTLDISRDGQFLLLAESNISSYPVHIYSVEDGEVIATTNHGGFNFDRNAISGEAGLVAVAGYNEVTLYDFNLNSVADLTGIFGNSEEVDPVFSRNGEYLFLVNVPFFGDAAIAIVSTSNFEIVSFVDLPQNISSIVEIDISPDGLSLVITDGVGVHYFDFSDSEFTIDGTSNADALSGDNFNELIRGFAGDDVLEGGAGNDTLDGGAGIDTASYEGSADRVSILLYNGTALGGAAQGDTLIDIENVIGSAFADTLIGDSVNDNSLFGGDGNDALYGLAGNDMLNGGNGDDTLFGGAHNDLLNGDAGNDILIGGGGTDTLVGGEGIDTASYEASADRVSILLYNGTAFGSDAQGDTLTGIENVIGSAFADTLIGDSVNDNGLFGGDGNDSLYGLGGNDVLNGGAGADLIDGGASLFDVADYSTSDAAVTVRLYNNVNTGGHAEGDTIFNVEGVTGSEFSDILIGSSTQIDVLRGGEGNDALFGLAGNDTLIGGAGADVLDGGASNADTADYSGSEAGVTVRLYNGTGLGGDAQGDTLTNIESVIGSNLNDTLIGSSTQTDILKGGDGIDGLFGLAGNDILDGGAGNDNLSGGAGNDVFVFADGFGQDTITDFVNGFDRLDVSGIAGVTSIADFTISQIGADVVITLDANNNITLQNTLIADIDANDFVF